MSQTQHAWVVLTMGDRPFALDAALASIVRTGPGDLLVVANGGDPASIRPIVATHGGRLLALDTNVGIAAGRNRGMEATTAPVVFYLDDDAEVASGDLVASTLAMFDEDAGLGTVSFHIVDPVSGTTAKRHVPRLGGRRPERSGEVTAYLGGAHAHRRAAFEEAGGYDDRFVYAMEETDLSLRLADARWRMHYRGDLVVHHPATEPSRHPDSVERTARNRAVLARRNLPWPLSWCYIANWCAITALRQRSLGATRALIRGTRSGARLPVGGRPIGWRTVVHLARLGRPPVI